MNKADMDEIYGAQATQASAWVKSCHQDFSTKRLLGNVSTPYPRRWNHPP
jgi:hypothetical protein